MKRLRPELIEALNNAPALRWRISPHTSRFGAKVQFTITDPLGRLERGFLAHPYPFDSVAEAMNYIAEQYRIAQFTVLQAI